MVTSTPCLPPCHSGGLFGSNATAANINDCQDLPREGKKIELLINRRKEAGTEELGGGPKGLALVGTYCLVTSVPAEFMTTITAFCGIQNSAHKQSFSLDDIRYKRRITAL